MSAGAGIDRRDFLRGAASAVALTSTALALKPAPAQGALVVRQPYLMAMHLHACFSEGDGSMAAHLQQARSNNIDVVWWTEHDHRMAARGYLETVHFNSLKEYTNGLTVTWRSVVEGALASSSAAIVTTPVFVGDPGGKALRVQATSRASGQGTRRLIAEPTNYGLNTSLTDTVIGLQVRPTSVGENAWVDIQLTTSHRPPTHGREAGQYTIIYRIGGTRPAGARRRLDDHTGLVVLDAKLNRWNAVVLAPVADMNGFWPDSDFRDSALTEFSLGVTSRGAQLAQAVFDALTFDRQRRTSAEVIQTQEELMAFYAAKYPKVRQHRGMEVSESTPHLNWFGAPRIWRAQHPGNRDVGLAIERIHTRGGVVSYNHPYGSSGGPYSTSQRISKRRSVTSTLVRDRLFAADALEVAYLTGRAGMMLSDYIALWDVLSRNAIFTTATGATDDHSGRNWISMGWRAVTGVWSDSDDLEPLLESIRAGRAWIADPAKFKGTIELLANGYIEMGQAGRVAKSRVELQVVVDPLPAKWSIAVIRGEVDEAGPNSPDPKVTTSVFAAAAAVDGVLTVKMNTAVSRFVRVELRDPTNVTRAYSNPVWLLRETPVNGIPDQRLAIRPSE